MKFRLKCVTCGKEVEGLSGAATCSNCGPFNGTLDVIYPLEAIKGRFKEGLSETAGRNVFEAFLPIFPFENLASLPSLQIGDTPFFKSPNLSTHTGMGKLWIKDDGRNPSASFKDRASAVAIAMARESGVSPIAAASTGNAASSLATLAASVSIPAILFVPANAPRPKLTQILIHGGHIFRLNCDYDTAFDLCQKACERFGWYNRNTATNPFTGEGKKSAALEIARDLGKAPDAIICPVGDGCIIEGLHKGFSDLLGLGLIDHLPSMYGVQAEGADPVVRAFNSADKIVPIQAKTVADSISVGYPRDGVKALRAVRQSQGVMISVSDRQILEAQKVLASKAGIFAEPAASAAMAGLLALAEKGTVSRKEVVVLVITGHGLKDIDTAFRNISSEETTLEPNLDAISRQVERIFSKP